MGKVPSVGLTVSGIPVNDAIKAGDLVGISGGKMVRALAAAGGSQVKARGVAAASYRAGDTGSLHTMAEVDGFSGLAIGDSQYLHESMAGDIQPAAPVGAGKLSQAVGFAVAADRVMFVFQDAGVVL
jgi:hypothetical protein